MNEWHDLFVATSGSAAALTGLIFVAVSINLNRILTFNKLADRALLSLVLLLSILIISVLLLIPNQSQNSIGIEVIVLFSVVWFYVTRIDVSVFKNTTKKYRSQYRIHVIANQLAILPYLIAGITLFFDLNTGIGWIVPAICFCFIKAIWDAWILLVEINR